MKFGVVNQPSILNRFVLHTLQRKITHLAVITRKTNIKLGILKRGELEKSLLFVFFSTANRILYANKHFPKKIFCMQNLIFCVHNIVLDTIIWLFFFSLKFFFSKTLKMPISFVLRVYVCLDQCLLTSKFKNLK